MSYPYTPRELVALPFNLRRSQLYPVNPPLVEQAMQEQIAGATRPTLMPQKTMFTKWHTGPARRQYLSTALSALDAGGVFTRKISAITEPIEADKGIFTPFEASRVFNKLPQPMENFEFNSDPIARDMLARPITQAPALDVYARGQTPDVVQRTLLSTALEGDMTPLGGLGRVGAPRARKGFLRGLGRAGMGFAALGDPFDIMAQPSFDPKAEGVPLPGAEQTSNRATPGASSQVVTTVKAPIATPSPATPNLSKWGTTFYALAGLLGAGAGIYHGWKRTHSTSWTVAWGVAGGIFPIFAVPIMFVQGFGKRS